MQHLSTHFPFMFRLLAIPVLATGFLVLVVLTVVAAFADTLRSSLSTANSNYP